MRPGDLIHADKHGFLVIEPEIQSSILEAARFMDALECKTVDPAYYIYPIPSILLTAKGTTLAWCEARKRPSGVSEWDDIRILMRRSTDEGHTWSPPTSIAHVDGPKRKKPLAASMKNVDQNDVTYNNPVLIADRDGTVHMLFCLEYERCFYQSSTDDGLTWTPPVEITATFENFKKHYAWKVLATGPNHSIQLKTGRLVVPVWLSTGTGGIAHRPSPEPCGNDL